MSKNRKQVHNTLSFYSGMDIIVANYPQLEAECAGNRFVIAWAGRLSVIIHCPQPRLLGSLDNGEANPAPLLQSRITNMDIMCSYFLRVMSVLPVAKHSHGGLTGRPQLLLLAMRKVGERRRWH